MRLSDRVALRKPEAKNKAEVNQLISDEEIIRMNDKQILKSLKASLAGLSSREAEKRIRIYGRNVLREEAKKHFIIRLLSHFKSPLIIILLFAGVISGFFGEVLQTIIIFSIVLLSVALDFYQESKAENAAELLKKKVTTFATVLRDGQKKEVKISEIVPGDILILSAGDIVPADARIIEAKDLFINQSALTGESFPIEKTGWKNHGGINSLSESSNYIFMGSAVVSGSAKAIVVRTGSSTEYGKIAQNLSQAEEETDFDKGIKSFGYLIMKVTFMLVIFIFFVLALFKQNVVNSLLFSVALAVGLTPELLPMIMSINLSKGAMSMSKKGVIVKKLSAIQNFGTMDVLCTDKTGTLTENKIILIKHIDIDGKENQKVLRYSYVNSFFQTGLRSPLDEAVLDHKGIEIKACRKIDEIPFDFTRKRISVVISEHYDKTFITKGAPEEILKICSSYEHAGKIIGLNTAAKEKIIGLYQNLSKEGFRVLGVSCKKLLDGREDYSIHDEKDMVFLGFIAFIDPPKQTAGESLEQLKKSGIEVKVLTGDNELVTRKVCQQLGFDIKGIVLGSEVALMNDTELSRSVENANIFARVTPDQKNRIITALKKNNHVVGFMGDGINDAPSLKTADIGISVDNAVDVAKESADIVLSHKSLKVLHEGVLEGRKTFANMMKYLMMGTSSSFGNMFSMAGASVFLPFLPMLPIQILLNNFLYDISESTIPTDNVDSSSLEKPERLDIGFIKRFMLVIGLVSSAFDFLTFYIMLTFFSATAPVFQTAWFIESLCTQALVIFAIRTRRFPFYKSRPSRPLLLSTLAVVCLAILIPFTIIGEIFGFVQMPIQFFAVLSILVISYLIVVELVKNWFYKRYSK